jgi:hypothetical protein
VTIEAPAWKPVSIAQPCRPRDRESLSALSKRRKSVAYDIIKIEDNVVHVRISGIMQVNDQKALQNLGKRLLTQGKKLKLFITLDDFQGWEKGADWSDIDFFMAHGNDIDKMAIVGDEMWKDQIFAFVGKGLRTTVIEYFSPSSLKEADTWIRG